MSERIDARSFYTNLGDIGEDKMNVYYSPLTIELQRRKFLKDCVIVVITFPKIPDHVWRMCPVSTGSDEYIRVFKINNINLGYELHLSDLLNEPNGVDQVRARDILVEVYKKYCGELPLVK
jgi:hypothetical protein